MCSRSETTGYREQEKKSIELFQANLEAELAKLRESNRRQACALEVTLGEVAQ